MVVSLVRDLVYDAWKYGPTMSVSILLSELNRQSFCRTTELRVGRISLHLPL
jgi:hypothetical protein